MADVSRLFSYGTLMCAEVMKKVLGYIPEHQVGVLRDYQIYSIHAEHYPAVLPSKGSCVHGLVYSDLNIHAMKILDAYEGCEYQRKVCNIIIGNHQVEAYTYVYRSRFRFRLARSNWDIETFKSRHLSEYIQNIHQ